MHAPSLWPCFKLLYQGNWWKRNCLNRPELLTISLLSLVHPCIVIQPLYLIQCGSSEEEEKLLTYRESTTTIHWRTLTLQICISLRWVSALILKYVNDKGVSKQLSALIWLNSAHSHIMRQHHCDFWQLWINSRLLTNVKSADSKTTRDPY